ncbi:cytochrome P450 [Polyplosphaeria fusca]|uniref:Cytochrome P450 n=1 Tax=Polyplosphaeria fusca TaxID=682080 RepID=A0A9P4QSY7_9PLEO|nr:cytochrome P450 [Polyplosphaeria fusca]
MAPLSILIALVALAACLLLFVRHLLFHPLRKIPKAHPTISITSLWIRYHRRGGSQAIQAISNAHTKHGPIVRLGPNEISVSSFEAANKVYIERGGFAKPKWWAEEFTSYGVINMVAMQGGVGDKTHAERKRAMGSVYAKSSLMKSEALHKIAKRVLGDMFGVLEKAVRERGGEVDAYSFSGAVNADFISAFQFGSAAGTRFVEDTAARDSYYESHDTWLRGKPGHERAQKSLESFGLEQIDAAEFEMKEKKSAADAVVYKQLRSRGLQGKHLASEILDHFIAGAEAPRSICAYLQWELSRKPGMQKRVRDEVHSLPAADQGPDTSYFKAVEALPLLEALLLETMRVYTPTPGPQHRLTPLEGTIVHGYHIPGGVAISATLSVLHHNAAVFPQPEQWDPDRWLTDDQDKLEEMRRWFWAFSKGSRTCVGKDFTLIVMKLVLCGIYSRYRTSIVDDAGFDEAFDAFLAGPESERLILKYDIAN